MNIINISQKHFNYIELPGILNNLGIRARLKLREINNFMIKRDYYNFSNLIKLNKKSMEKKLSNEKKEHIHSKIFFKKKFYYFEREKKKNLSTLLKQEIKLSDEINKLSKNINEKFNNLYSQKFLNNKKKNKNNLSSYSLGKSINPIKDISHESISDIKSYFKNTNPLTQKNNKSKYISPYNSRKKNIYQNKIKLSKNLSCKNYLSKNKFLIKNNLDSKNKTFITNLKPKIIYTSYGYINDCPFLHPNNSFRNMKLKN